MVLVPTNRIIGRLPSSFFLGFAISHSSVGSKDEAELKMRCYKQMNSIGEIEALEKYLSMKQELIN
jgi:hypothetical protein